MPDRYITSTDYRFGYNGMEKDDEVKGINGSSYTTYFRQYDSRLGRWLSTDPAKRVLPWQSTYCAMDNNPVLNNDPLGDIVKYEKFRDRVNVFFNKIISKKFRQKHKSRKEKEDVYTYRKVKENSQLRHAKDTPQGDGQYDVLYSVYGPDWGGIPDWTKTIKINIPKPNINIEWEERKTKEVVKHGDLEVPRPASGTNPSYGPYTFNSPKNWVPGTEIKFLAQPHPDRFTFLDQNGNIISFTDPKNGNTYNSPFTIVSGGVPLIGVENVNMITAPQSDLTGVTSWTITVTSQRYYTPVSSSDKFIPPSDNKDVFSIRYTRYIGLPKIKKISISWD